MKRLFASLALLGCVAPATAQEYCVSCAEPDAVYRCVIAGARPGLAQTLQMACLTALSKDGKHGTCAIKRGVTVFECDGPVKTVSPGTETEAGSAAAVVPPPAAAAPDPKAPPKTVLEAAQRAQKATDAEMRKAGEATSTFFKRTFACIGSLFTRCGG